MIGFLIQMNERLLDHFEENRKKIRKPGVKTVTVRPTVVAGMEGVNLQKVQKRNRVVVEDG